MESLLNSIMPDSSESTNEAPAQNPSSEPVQLEKPKDDPFSKKFAALSRKERDFSKREKDLARREAQLRSSQPVTKQEPAIPFEQRLKQDPLRALKEAGLGYEKLTELALNDGKLPMDMQMQLMREELEAKTRSEIDSIRKQLEDRDLESAKRNEEETLNNFKKSIENAINSSDKFRHIKETGLHSRVFDTIQNHYDQSGSVLDVEEAAALVEKEVEDHFKSLFTKLGYGASKPESDPSLPPSEKSIPPSLSYERTASLSPAHSQGKSYEEIREEAKKLLRWED